jgi:Subtilase family
MASTHSSARRVRGALLGLLLCGSALPAAAPTLAPRAEAPSRRVFLRARSSDPAHTGALRDAEVRLGLHEAAAYESGCRMVDLPAGVSVDDLRQRVGEMIEVSPSQTYRVARSVDDPLYAPDQAATFSAIHAPEAWDAFPGQAPGSGQVVVAILDTGVDRNNVDLSATLPLPALDPSAGDFSALTSDSTDRNGHGTASAGIIAARGDNGVGIAGVAWGTGLLPLKCFDDAGESTDDRLIRCYDYLTAIKTSGALDLRVANNGWSGLSASSCLMDAIGAAGKAGILSVFAAGNGTPARDLDATPGLPATASLPTTISVAAADLDGTLTEDSNYGATTVDLAAPGRNVTSLGLCPPGAPPCPKLVEVSGTSFAAPFVSAAAALLFAQDPSRRPAEVKRLLTGNVTLYPGLSGLVRTGGLVNVAAALAGSGSVDAAPPPPVAQGPSPMPLPDGTYAVDVAEFPGPAQKSPPIQPEAGYLFVRTVEGIEEQRWLLLGWEGHRFLRPPLHSMGMNVRPISLPSDDPAGAPVGDLPGWVAFAEARAAAAEAVQKGLVTYAKVALVVTPYGGPLSPLAPAFAYPPYLDPPPPARAAVAQVEPAMLANFSFHDPGTNQFSTVGYAYARSDGANQTREHWLVFGQSPPQGSSLVVGSMGEDFGVSDFASFADKLPWSEGSTLVLGSVRYYSFVAE